MSPYTWVFYFKIYPTFLNSSKVKRIVWIWRSTVLFSTEKTFLFKISPSQYRQKTFSINIFKLNTHMQRKMIAIIFLNNLTTSNLFPKRFTFKLFKVLILIRFVLSWVIFLVFLSVSILKFSWFKSIFWSSGFFFWFWIFLIGVVWMGWVPEREWAESGGAPPRYRKRGIWGRGHVIP